jgi:Protein-disulfide isomerase
MKPTSDEPTRRRLLFAAAAGTATLAGCISGDSGDDTEGNGGEDTDDQDANTNTNGGDDSDETTASSVPVRGDPEAAVTLEVYEDLGCPACRNYIRNGLPELEAEYIENKQIRYEHRDFVVTGTNAAQAASAARETLARHGTDAFWAFVDAVFANQERLNSEGSTVLGELASDLELDADAIETAGAERTHQSVVERDKARGLDTGVSATPSFVVDGELVDPGDAGSMSEVVAAVSDSLDAALDGSGDDGSDPYGDDGSDPYSSERNDSSEPY